jgi:hypothetical protein
VQLFRWGLWLALSGGAVLIVAKLGVTGVAVVVLVIGVMAMVVGYAKARW